METAQNSFNGGLLMDMNDTVVPNTVLTDCLNGTIITFDGNEFILQNDSGNGRVESCALKKDFIPLGIKQYGGIIYIASVNPFTNECEIGSFPSPERNITSDELPDNLDVSILNNDIYKDVEEGKESKEGLQINYLKVDFGDLEKSILRPGDKFLIYIDGINGDSNYTKFNEYYKELNYYIDKEGIGKRRLYHLHLAKISENGMVTYIEEQTSAWNENHQKFFYTKDEAFDNTPALNTVKNPALFSVYNDKLNGYLAIVLEIEDIDSFSVDLGNVSEHTENNTYDVEFTVNSSSKSYNNVCGIKLSIKDTSNIVSNSKEETTIKTDDGCLEISGQYQGISSTILTEIPNEDITIEGKITNLNLEDSNSITIEPYSRFQFFKDLKYTLDLSYSRVTSAQESTTWRYFTKSIKDYNNNEFKQVEISTDFLVKGTKNGLNRCNVMYIEFYDIHAKTSFIYPLSKVISGTYNFTVDCFPKEFNAEPYYDQDGNKLDNPEQYLNNLRGNNINTSNKIFISKTVYSDIGYSGYFLLLDKTKQREYLDAIAKARNNNSDGLATLKKLCLEEFNGIPRCIFIKPQLGDNESYFYNNCFTQEQYVNSSVYNKLRFNNFYICRLCGLDIYKEVHSTESILFDDIYGGKNPKYKEGWLSKNCSFKEYNVVNTLATNGWFNNEYSKPITDSNRNFSILPIQNYETKRISKELVLTETPESISKQLTVQGPTTKEELILDSDPTTYSTKLNVEKTISGTYSLDTINLFQYGEIEITNASATPQFTEISIEENNNIPSLPTNSEIISQKTTDVSVDENIDNRKITVVSNLKREIEANAVLRKISGDSIQYVKAANSLSIMGFNENSITSGITFFDDLNGNDWILINTASSKSLFSNDRVRDSWWSSDSDAIIYDKSKVSSNSSLVLNRIQKMFNLNNSDFKIAVIGFAGGNKTPKSGEYSPTTLNEQKTGASVKVSSTKLLRDGTKMDVPYTYLILYKNTANPNYPIGVLPLVFRGGTGNEYISTSIGKFFDNLYKEEVKPNSETYNKYIPNDIRYHSNFDSIIKGNATLNTVYNSDIIIDYNNAKKSLSKVIDSIITTYKTNTKKGINIVLNGSITIPDYSQENINKSFNIPLSYTFKSGIFSTDLSIYSKIYNTAASYSDYIDLIPHDYLSYKLNNKFIPMEKLTIKDKGFYFSSPTMDTNNGPHSNAISLELNVYKDSENIQNLHCNASDATQFVQCDFYIGWDPLFKNSNFTEDLGNVENFFSILTCS